MDPGLEKIPMISHFHSFSEYWFAHAEMIFGI
jgi:hypothetical protein